MIFLITRHLLQSQQTANKLAKQGYKCYINPLVEIINFPLLNLSYIPHSVVLTSQQAVLALEKLARSKDVPLFTSGSITAECAAKRGFKNITVASGTIKSLNALLEKQPINFNHSLLYIRGYDITAPLYHSKARIRNVIAYQAQLTSYLKPEVIQGLRTGLITGILLFSKRMAQHFERLSYLNQFSLKSLTAFCLSPAIAAVLQGSWLSIQIMDMNEA